MIEITPKMIKSWSTVGQRATLGLVLYELAKTHKNLFIVTADVSTSAGLDRFRKTYPDQFLDVGIAEQNMIGVAAGIANNGFNVITTTFAPFQSLRCAEQIKVDLAYTGTKALMVGLASGLTNGPLGNTHCCIEDVGALRSIPNLKLIAPADCLSVAKAVITSLNQEAPVYIRLTGGANHPIVYQEDIKLVLGKAVELKSGTDVSIFANGSSVFQCLQASDILRKNGISVSVWDMHTIKPIDKVAIEKAASSTSLIVGVEEHNILGGLSSAIAEYLYSRGNSPPLLSLGIQDIFLKPGNYQYMLEQSGLTPEGISTNILNALTKS